MNLSTLELQQATGFPIVEGSLSIKSETDVPASLRKHDRLLLSSQRELSGELTWSRGMAIWPVEDVARDEHGFCQATLGEFGLIFRSFKLLDNETLPRPSVGRQSYLRGGTGVGNLIRREPFGTGWIENAYEPIRAYELNAEYGSEGMHIAVSGQFEQAEGEQAVEFSIAATIPWETLKLKGFHAASASWTFGRPQPLPSKFDSADRRRDPKKLADLLIGARSLYVEGQMSFASGTTYYRPKLNEKFLSIQIIGLDAINFSGPMSVKVLADGFADSSSYQSSSLTIAALGRYKLEEELQKRDTLAIQVAGDLLGSARHFTGYGWEPGDPFNWIEQRIKTLSLRATLGREGLEFAAEGELNDFDPEALAAHREQRNSQLVAPHTYTLRATIPWAFLVAREFGFAYRMMSF